MRFSSISNNLLEFFRIMPFVFDLKYLSQNSINFNMLGECFGILRMSSFQNCPWICILSKGDIEGFTLLKVLLATTVSTFGSNFRVNVVRPFVRNGSFKAS